MTLNYSLHSKSNYFIDDLLEVVARNRGIKDINKIKNPSINDVIHYSKLVNMDKAIKVFDAFIQTGEVIDVATIVDEDFDGIGSSSILTMYLEKNFPNVRMHFLFHKRKQHGITEHIMNQINELDNLDILFTPDSASSDFDQHKELYERGIPVICLDHHTTPHLSEHAIVVNNQTSPEYSNKQLSGTGITMKFLEALDDFYGLDDSSTYKDISAISQVADSIEIGNNPETLYITYDGIKNLHNPLIKEFIFKTIGKYEKVYPHTLSFGLIPKFNAVIRVGTLEEKKKLFFTMIGREEEFYNTRTKKTESAIETSVRISINAHSRQNTAKKKWLSKIKDKIAEQALNSRPILVVTFNKKDKFDNALGGVIASSLTNIYRKPVLMLTYNEEKKLYSGSIRGYEDFTPDLKAFLEELNVFDWIQGHPNAAGCQISEDNLLLFNKMQDNAKEYFNLEENNKENSEIKVDFIIDAKNMRGGIVDEVSKYEKYWCKGLSSPIFCVTNIKADMNDVKISSGGMLKIEVNGVNYTQFTASEDWIELAETNQVVTFDAIGTMGINEFLGKSTRQFIMDNYVIKSVEESKKKKVLFEF